MDVTGLYTNIDHSEGIKAVREIREQYRDDNVKNIFILELLELVLSQNIFEFDKNFSDKKLRQLWEENLPKTMPISLWPINIDQKIINVTY